LRTGGRPRIREDAHRGRTGDSTTKSQTSGYQADERIEPASVELTANRQEDVLAVGDRAYKLLFQSQESY
ncbi:hypothetical protein KC216_21195, partial [Mycobacterium tuberculosis]|nr:hypothetical protein [Mycobacterium tuberculosis]